jgi:hypothetical protein
LSQTGAHPKSVGFSNRLVSKEYTALPFGLFVLLDRFLYSHPSNRFPSGGHELAPKSSDAPKEGKRSV